MSNRQRKQQHARDVRSLAHEENRAAEHDRHRGERSGSALVGHVDYADLAERVVQGVTVTRDHKRDKR
jgi:hypothetical protein